MSARNGQQAGRITVFVAVFMAFTMLGIPSFQWGDTSIDMDAVGNAGAAISNRVFKVGWFDLKGDIATLNPFSYTSAGEYLVIWAVYSMLLMYNLEATEIIGDLAENYTLYPDGVTYRFDLYRNARFYDPANPSAVHPVTVEDVAWTYWAINNDTKNSLHTYLPGVIDDIWTDGDPYSFYIRTKYPFAPLLSAISTVPILPKYIWSTVNIDAYDGAPMVGSGPFYYTGGSSITTEVRLYANPIYYQTENRGWQVHTGQYAIVSYTDTTPMWNDLVSGVIDCMVFIPPPMYVQNVMSGSNPDIKGFAQGTGFVYEFNLNQMTDELRAALGGSYATGTNNQLLLDPTVKKAMAMCVNKTNFVEEVLLGLGQEADSLVPDNNAWHYWYGLQPDEGGRAPEGEEPLVPDTQAARALLRSAGWDYDSAGNVATADTCPLYKIDGEGNPVDPLSFRMYSLTPEEEWNIGTNLIAEWCAEAGVLLHGNKESDPPELMAYNKISSLWYSADYDCWLWDWWMSPLSEPSLDVLSVATTMEIGSWSDIYWSNETYDALYNQSLVTVDRAARMEITDTMQRMLYEEYACQCVAYRKELYGVYTPPDVPTAWNRESIGDWEAYFNLMPDWATPFLYTRVYPNENHAPAVSVAEAFTTDIEDTEFTISVNAGDDITSLANLQYRWFWGDGTKTGWITGTSSAQHQYTKDGNYTAYVAVKERSGDGGFDDGFITWADTKVKVYDYSNDAPTGLSIARDPESDVDTGTNVTFVGSATDPEGDELYYEWLFGDGYSGYGQETWHQYTTEGDYTVTMKVTDGHFGTGTRPAVTSEFIHVGPNGPPSIIVPEWQEVQWKVESLFSVEASDPNPRDTLRYTWDWGDGTVSVTDGSTAPHTYTQKLTFTLTVYVDDLTGLPGHNVSESGTVVVRGTETAPVILEFSVDNANPIAGEVVTFTGTARDAEGDPMRFTFWFGDGSGAVVNSESTYPDVNVPMSFDVTHAYDAGGTWTARLYVDSLPDQIGYNVSSSTLSITVSTNDPPIVSPVSDFMGTTGVQYTYSVSAVDPDGDSLTYTWDFGDETPLVVTAATSVVHTYAASGEYTFTVYVDDGLGGTHNVSSSATATMNAIPVLSPLGAKTFYVGVSRDVTAYATDADGDAITYTWDFGDETPLQVGQTVSHTYYVETTYTITVWANDGFPVTGHNVSTTTTATVTSGTGNSPPDVDPLSPKTGVVNVPLAFSATASDVDDDTLTYTWEFGDGEWAVGQSVTHAYASADVYTFIVHVDDGLGGTHNVSAQSTATISADEAPVADAGPDDSVDEDELYTFNGIGSSDDVGVVDFMWTIVELSVTLANEATPTYTFDTPGVYHVQLVVTDTIGQESSADEMVLTVNDITPPTADAGTDQTENRDVTITFDGSGSSDNSGAIVSWEWTFVDGVLKTLEGETATYTFTVFGEYGVTLTVTDGAGLEDTDFMLVNVTDLVAPVVDAGGDQSVSVGEEVTLDASGTTDNFEDTYLTYTWTFDDGGLQTLDGVTATYTFDTEGEYLVTLTVMDAGYNIVTDEVTITVTAEVQDTTPPVADAGVDVTVEEGDIVTFDGSGSTDDSGSIENYTWTFEYDGVARTLYGVSPTWTFSIADEYTVTLNVTDAAGNYDTDTMVVTVEAANVPPVANAGSDATVTVGATHTFSGADSSDSDGTVENYTWTFTYDGQTKTLYGVAPSWTFDIVGTYTVTLTVTDDDGATATDTVTITVEEEGEGFPLVLVAGGIIALLAAIVLAMVLMRRRKSAGEEEAPPTEEAPPPS